MERNRFLLCHAIFPIVSKAALTLTMLWSRPIVYFVVLWLAGWSAAESPLDERIREADALQDKGSSSEARKIYEPVLATLRSRGDSPQLGYVLNALSEVASAEGNYDEGISRAQEAADVYHRLGEAKGEARALNYRGIAEVQRGFYGAARGTLSRALALSRSAGDLESQTRILNNLGTADFYPGDYLEALRAYESALDIVEKNSALSWSSYWRQITEINEATIYQRLGRYQKALEIYQRDEKSSHALTPSDQAHLLTNLGALYRRLGDAWKALDQYQLALNLYARQHDADGEISTLKNIGIVYALDRGDLGNAQRFFERALRRAIQTHNQREEMQAHLYLGETYLRKGALVPSADEFHKALAQARQLGTTEEQWKALYGTGRTVELSGEADKAETDYREAVSIIEASRSQLQLSALRAEFFADKRDVFDALIALLLKKNDVREAFLFLEKSRARTFQDRLASSNSPRPGPGGGTSLSEIRGYLDDSTILLEFWTAGDQLALIWCTRDASGAVQNRISPEDQAKLLSLLRGLPENLRADWRDEARVLARLVPGGLPLPPTIRRAFIVPDGWLSSVPFDLLPFEPGSNALLIERLEIAYLPSAAFLRGVIHHSPPLRWPWMRQLIAFGAPIVQGSQFEPNLETLPHSEDEIRHIAAMGSGQAELFLGPADSKKKFLSDTTKSAPILHVSTHAFADADNPENSRIMFSPETPGGDSDYVFLRELYDLDLSGVDLATFSACNTERGTMFRGEGIQAFSRALLSAGSGSALTTLWRIDDQPTSEFMKQFYYFALQKNQPKAQALRSAKLKFLHSGTALENPAHWAGFVLNGDGFNPLPAFVSWRQLAATGSAVVLLAALAGTWLRSRRRRRLHRGNRS